MNKNDLKTAFIVVVCVLLNVLGGKLATLLDLPIWMDSFGTVISAYAMGPFVGAIVGATGNIIFGMIGQSHFMYLVISIFIGVTVGIATKKGMLETFYGTISLSIIITMGSLLVAVPIDLIVTDGLVGNSWGAAVVGFLENKGVSTAISVAIGQFYVEILDKFVTLVVVFLAIHIRRKLKDSNVTVKKDQAALLLVFLLVLGSIPVVNVDAANSDDSTYVYTVYGSNNGLPCGEANDVAQTNDGVLWVGTYAGLYRYNGIEFKLVGEFDTVRNVNCLFPDRDSRLWIGTNDNGLAVSIDEKICYKLSEEDGLSSNSVRNIVQGYNGYYYVGTSEGLDLVSLDSGLHYVDSFEGIKYVQDGAVNKNGLVAIVDTNGDLYMIKDDKIITKASLPDKDEIIMCCAFDNNNNLLVGTSGNRVISYNFTADTLTKKAEYICGSLKNINEVQQINKKEIYVCSDTGIGYLNANKKFIAVNTGEFNNSVDNMMVDFQGNLWFASSRLGLLKMSDSTFTDIYTMAGVDSTVVNSNVEWRGSLYSGTDTGLDIIAKDRRSEIETDLTKELKDVRIRCLTVDQSNHLWICTYGNGLYEAYDENKFKVYNASNSDMGNWVRVARCLEDGTVVVGSESGLSFIREDKIARTVTADGDLVDTMILSIEQLDDGRILCGTDGDGIVVLNPTGQVVKKIRREDGLSSGVILRTVEDSKGEGVFIVGSNGLGYMNEESYKIRELDNFPYYNNYDLWKITNREICILSSAGVYVVDERKLISGEELTDIVLLDVKKGLNGPLVANSWNYMANDGCLYLSCDNGIYMLDTKNYDTVRKSYRMRLSKVMLDNKIKRIGRGEDIIIGENTKKISLYPEIINYSLEDPYVSYYLEGIDDSPSVCRLSEFTTVNYSNVPAGKYRFFVSVLDSDSDRIIEGNSYSVTKIPHKYDRGYFVVYLLLIAAGAIAWITWFFGRARLQRTMEIQKIHLEMADKQLEMANQTIVAIANAVDAKDANTSQHSKRVSEYSVMIAKKMGLSKEECDNIRNSALLHDIGKIGIPDSVLKKPARLTDEEYAIMKSHVTRGADILKEFTLVDRIVEGALYHHEKYDGTGYVHGLKGKDIPLYGRIIGVADAFDAMTANRVYRQKLDFDYVLNELKRCRGTQFDPEILDIFLELIDEGAVDIERLYKKPEDVNTKKEEG